MKKRIIIIGGGYIGAELAKSLDDAAEVTLIEQNSHFVHAPAMIRAVVDPDILDRALIPYDGLLKHGRLIQDRAQSVSETGVTLASGEQLEADFIVVATGSSNAVPFKSNGADIETLRAANARVHALLSTASTVAIVGAGAVGTELAGEIAHGYPDKKVHLISSEPQLFANFPEKLGRKLAAKLEHAGVVLVLGARAENLQSLTEPYSGTLILSTGQSLAADLIFPVIGSKATSTLLEALPEAKLGRNQRIKTDVWMRPSTYDNVFAAGDVAEMGDAMTIVATSRQLTWLKKTLTALVNGQKIEDLKPYTPFQKAPILVPLGPVKGNSFLSLFVAGDFLTSLLKGKDLFLSKYNKLLGKG
ncbi:NAD(P)/FAD-dependent oxidoreductase [Granulosicoccus antarcticus]|uniref:Nitric oxide reductase FlRd-NAD(+) reductase n=1 Tax=Granulosicoccus antarcticus IMCC3135 TaxID=1192854 RepID=A0A2Z2NT51_9GAMM|nr:FAD-dependent oxidoreductase [Granulosicoccus antarcticus]ASJ72918.1 Nitric oxide reductase FlRd-NAD(+) reductase [Granulosicoccus antarcticus IMCC3135]